MEGSYNPSRERAGDGENTKNNAEPGQRLSSPTPRYHRLTPTFEETIGSRPAAVVAAMDVSGDDPANQRPTVAVRVRSVGMGRKGVPIRVAHPLAPDEETILACDVDVQTALDADHRGIHVSRLGTAIAWAADPSHPSLAAFATTLCQRIHGTQYQGDTAVQVRSRFWYREPVPGFVLKADKESLDSVGLLASAELSAQGELCVFRGIEVDHITACPCVQQTLKHSIRQREPENVDHELRHAPLLTHSQRSRTSIEIGSAGGPDTRAILELVDRVLFRAQSTLPRPQELLLVLRSHERPQFLEDVLRDTARGLAQLCEGLDDATRIRVRSRSFESIHDYDLVGELELTLGELRAAG